MQQLDKEQHRKSLFIKFVGENKVPMYRFAYSIVQNQQDAEDVVSEAILRAYTHLEELRNLKKMKSWLFQILVNESRACLNQKKRIDLMKDVSQLHDNIQPMQETTNLLEFVYQLEEIFREVVILYYFEELSVREIAKILSVSEGTVKSRLSRARVKLKQFLENDDSWKG